MIHAELRLLVVAVGLLTAALLQAQPTFDWATKLTSASDYPRQGVAADPGGNVIVAYNSGTPSTNVLTKLNPQGGVMWSQRLSAYIGGIAADTNGDIYVTGGAAPGAFAGTGVTPQGTGGAYVAKYDHLGALQWVQLDGTTQTIRGQAVTVDQAGNYYMAGYYRAGNAQFGDTVLPSTATDAARTVFVVKYDKTGRLVWARVSEGSGYVWVNKIAIDRAGNVFVAGDNGEMLSFGNTVLTGPNEYLVKFDQDGNFLWARQTDTAGDSARVAVDQDGNAFMAYRSLHIVASKYSPAGDLLWSRHSEESGGDVAPDVTTDQDGNCLVAGGYGNGTITFENVTLTTVAREEVFVVKYSSSGELRWGISSIGKNPEGNGTNFRISDTRMNSIAVSPFGGCFVAGFFKGTVQFGATNLVGNANDGLQLAFVTHITDPDTAPPKLQIARAAQNVTLSWPVGATNYVLETATSLPALSWATVTNTPTVTTYERSVQLPVMGNAQFFRLKKP